VEIVTVGQLVQEIRDQADEQNRSSRDDDSIVRMLNRGQRFICSQIVRTYPAPLLKRKTVPLTNYDTAEGIEIPKDAFEDRVLQVSIDTPQGPTKVEQRAYNQVNVFEHSTKQLIPECWYIRGRRILFAPPPSGTYGALIDYVRQPDPLVLDKGRIESINTSENSIVVDSLGDGVVSNADDLHSYINIVDPLTGVIRGTLQVQSISNGNKIVFRTSPTRATVQGRAVSSSLTSIGAEIDDFICFSSGTCVPQFNQAFTTYLLQYGVAEVQRSLGDSMITISKSIADDAQRLSESMLAGRTRTARVKNMSPIWGGRRYSRFPTQK